MYKGKGKKRPAIQANNAYIRSKRDEYSECRTPGCRNIIANWATGAASNGFCAACRKR